MATVTLDEARKLVETHAIWDAVGPYRAALILPFDDREVQQWFWPKIGPMPTETEGLFQAWHRYPFQAEMAQELLARQVVRMVEHGL